MLLVINRCVLCPLQGICIPPRCFKYPTGMYLIWRRSLSDRICRNVVLFYACGYQEIANMNTIFCEILGALKS